MKSLLESCLETVYTVKIQRSRYLKNRIRSEAPYKIFICFWVRIAASLYSFVTASYSSMLGTSRVFPSNGALPWLVRSRLPFLLPRVFIPTAQPSVDSTIYQPIYQKKSDMEDILILPHPRNILRRQTNIRNSYVHSMSGWTFPTVCGDWLKQQNNWLQKISSQNFPWNECHRIR